MAAATLPDCCFIASETSSWGVLQEARPAPPPSGIMQLSTLSLPLLVLAYLAYHTPSATWAGTVELSLLLQHWQHLCTQHIC